MTKLIINEEKKKERNFRKNTYYPIKTILASPKKNLIIYFGLQLSYQATHWVKTVLPAWMIVSTRRSELSALTRMTKISSASQWPSLLPLNYLAIDIIILFFMFLNNEALAAY